MGQEGSPEHGAPGGGGSFVALSNGNIKLSLPVGVVEKAVEPVIKPNRHASQLPMEWPVYSVIKHAGMSRRNPLAWWIRAFSGNVESFLERGYPGYNLTRRRVPEAAEGAQRRRSTRVVENSCHAAEAEAAH